MRIHELTHVSARKAESSGVVRSRAAVQDHRTVCERVKFDAAETLAHFHTETRCFDFAPCALENYLSQFSCIFLSPLYKKQRAVTNATN